MSAWPRSLRLYSGHACALALCLLTCLVSTAAVAATRTVYVGDIYFSNNSGGSGGNTTVINAGDTIHWLWQGTLAHDTVSGTCSPGCTANGLWSSAVQTSGTFDRTFTVAGSYPYFCSIHGSGQVGTIVVNPGPASFLVLSGVPANATAGTAFNVTVTAYDVYGNVATGYGGTVSFTSSDGQATLPSGTLFSGSRVFSITMRTAGSQSLVANGTGVSSSGTAFVNVSPAATSTYTVVPSANPVNAGASFNVTVTAKDPYGNTTPAYGGTVHFTSSDGTATLPGNNTLVSGTRTFTGAILRTAGSQTITATDTINGAITNFATVTVNPGPATHIGISAPPSASAGVQFNITVIALDQFNNQATAYAGTVHFTSSDGGAVKPADSTLPSGLGIFPFTLNTVGSQSITATDTVTSSITGSTNVTVKPPCPAAPKTFSNNNVITFTSTGSGGTATTNPFPSLITVSGMTGTIGKLTLTLNGLTDAQCAPDLAFLLQGPHGQFMIPMSVVGPCPGSVNNVTLTLDDAAASALPGYPAALTSGTYRPASYYNQFSSFGPMKFTSPPAPAGPYTAAQLAATDGTATFANTFNGTDPNGTWNLFVMYQPQIGGFAETSTLAGWSLTITPQFASPAGGAITINDVGPSTPYPSTIAVSGLPGNITKLSVTINNFSHTYPHDVSMLLVGPRGQAMEILSDAGGGNPGVSNVTFTLDDSAAAAVPSANFAAGTYKPTDYFTDPFSPPAPAGPYAQPAPVGTATLASTFNGTDPNGTWSLYVLDDAAADVGTIGGWSLTFQTDCPAGTNCSVGSNANPSVFGQPVTFTATVNSGSGTPFGNVTFKDNGSALSGGALSGGMATFNTAALSVGSHPITVDYAGNTTFAASSSATLNQVVNKAATNSVVTSGGVSVFGQLVTFTATVTATAPGAGLPTGMVTFMDGASPLGTGALSGNPAQATLSTSALSVGSHTITVVYGGDGNFNGGTSANYTQAVNPGATATGVGSSVNPSVFGNSVMFTATVTVTPPAAGTPTGVVTFKDGVSTLGTGVVSGGTATFSTTSLSVGGHSITAVYGGDGNFSTSTSTPITQIVNQGTTTTGVGTSGSPSAFGSSVMFTATVAVATGAGTPTGTVTFKDGAATLGTGNLSGNPATATFSTSALSVGSHTITALYGGDGNFTGSTSGSIMQTVNQGTTTTVVADTSGSPSNLGDPVTFTATMALTSGAGTPTGTVTFKDGAATLGTGSVSAGTTATYTTTSPPPQLLVGSHTITAVYGGDANFSGSTSPGIIHIVNPGTSATTLISLPNPSLFGNPVLFTATVTSAGGTPTGVVNFSDGGTKIGSGTLDGTGHATFSTTGLAIGSHSMAAAYAGDPNFSASASTPLTQAVNPKAATNTSVISSLNPAAFGQTVTLTAAVTTASGTPTGTITFMDGATSMGPPVPLDGSGHAALTTNQWTIGSHRIMAVYSGDFNYAGSTSSVLVQRRSPEPVPRGPVR